MRALDVGVTALGVVGDDGLSELDRRFLAFGDRFEQSVVNQAAPRRLEESMGEGWAALSLLPASELHRLTDEQIQAHIQPAKT